MRSSTAVLCAAATLAACAGSRSEERAPTAARPAEAVRPAPPRGDAVMPPGTAEICPMDVPETTVAASDTPDGEALTFTTRRADQVGELRRRVHAVAQLHEQGHRDGGGPPGGATPGGAADDDHHHGHHPPMPPSHASVEDVDGGARVAVTPTDPAQAEALRAAARMQAMQLEHHGCGMMHAGPRG